MKQKIKQYRRSIHVSAAVFVILGTALLQGARAQEPPRWKAHDPARPRPPVVTPAPLDAPVPAPADAFVLFDGTGLSQWRGEDGGPARWSVQDGALVCPGIGEDIFTVRPFGDVQLHLEWAAPAPPKGQGQGRGNSGVFLMGLYEVQILDSYQNDTYADGQAASLYGQYPPLVNACRPPGEWQAYDIVFRRPRFGPGGTLESPARMTVFHNSILVQDARELLGPTMWLQHFPYTLHPDRLPISLQDHGNPVRFRNIWVRALRECEEPGPEPRSAEPGIVLSPEDLERYVGVYRYRPDSESTYDIVSDGRQLYCIFGEKRARVDLVAHTREKFSMRWTAAHVEFELDAEGRAAAMTLHVSGSSFTVKRVE